MRTFRTSIAAVAVLLLCSQAAQAVQVKFDIRDVAGQPGRFSVTAQLQVDPNDPGDSLNESAGLYAFALAVTSPGIDMSNTTFEPVPLATDAFPPVLPASTGFTSVSDQWFPALGRASFFRGHQTSQTLQQLVVGVGKDNVSKPPTAPFSGPTLQFGVPALLGFIQTLPSVDEPLPSPPSNPNGAWQADATLFNGSPTNGFSFVAPSSVVVVPEPASVTLLGLGAGALGLVALRRRKAA